MVSDIVIEPAQDLVATIDQHGFDAESRKDACELNSDVAAANDNDAGRETFQIKGLVRGDRKLVAGQMSGNEGRGSRGDQNMANPLLLSSL